MTAATIDPVALDLRLPYREHPKEPPYSNREAHVQWAVEQLVEFWAESGEAWPLGIIQQYRRDLSRPEIEERALALCTASVEAESWRQRHGHWDAYEVAQGEYLDRLDCLTGPVQS